MRRTLLLFHRPLTVPLLVGVLTFAFVWVGQTPPGIPNDFDYFWIAGQAIWHGLDPYAAVQAAIRQGILYHPLYYPGTAAVFVAPFGALSRHLGLTLFIALGMACLVFSVNGWRRWMFLSAPAIQAMFSGQWSPWLTAAVGLPWLGLVWTAKPSIGLALFAGWPSRRAFIGGFVLLILSLILVPNWPADWLNAVRHTPQYKAPVQRLGGALLLLSFLRWRRPEARMLGALALIPHTTVLYEQLPLLLIPKTGRAFAVLMGLGYLAQVLTATLVPHGPTNELLATLDAEWPYYLVLVYLPALYLTLRGSVSPDRTPPTGH